MSSGVFSSLNDSYVAGRLRLVGICTQVKWLAAHLQRLLALTASGKRPQLEIAPSMETWRPPNTPRMGRYDAFGCFPALRSDRETNVSYVPLNSHYLQTHGQRITFSCRIQFIIVDTIPIFPFSSQSPSRSWDWSHTSSSPQDHCTSLLIAGSRSASWSSDPCSSSS